jgi:hypothetical protein
MVIVFSLLFLLYLSSCVVAFRYGFICLQSLDDSIRAVRRKQDIMIALMFCIAGPLTILAINLFYRPMFLFGRPVIRFKLNSTEKYRKKFRLD